MRGTILNVARGWEEEKDFAKHYRREQVRVPKTEKTGAKKGGGCRPCL